MPATWNRLPELIGGRGGEGRGGDFDIYILVHSLTITFLGGFSRSTYAMCGAGSQS